MLRCCATQGLALAQCFLFKRGKRKALLIYLLFLLSFPSNASGYTHFWDRASDGEILLSYWPNTKKRPLSFSIDADPFQIGKLGSFAFGKRAVQAWGKIKGSSLRLLLKRLSVDIHERNFVQTSLIGDKRPDIILDKEGKILKMLGIDPEYVAGVGVPITEQNTAKSLKGPWGGKIIDALVIVNTRFTWKISRMDRIITHELGHALGIGHSNVTHMLSVHYLPLMFFDPNKPEGNLKLHADDRAALVSLYPGENFESIYGAMTGRVTRADGKIVFGAVAIARNTKTNESVGAWTDQEGRFFLMGLDPGNYELSVRALNGSKQVNGMNPALYVGGLYQKATPKFCPEFWNDQSFERCIVEPNEKTQLKVMAGTTLSGFLIKEEKDKPSPKPQCVLGSLFLWEERRQMQPKKVPNQGERGQVCPAVEKVEEKPVFEPPVDRFEPLVPDVREKAKESLAKEIKEVVPTCGCQSQSKEQGFLFILFTLFFFFFRKRIRLFFYVSIFFLASGFWQQANALSLLPANFSDVVSRCDRIVQVKVLQNRKTLLKDRFPMIETSFEIIKTLKGERPKKGKVLKIHLPASTHGRYRLHWQGIPRFAVGDRALLFLRIYKRTRFPILFGLTHGVYDLQIEKGFLYARGRVKSERKILYKSLLSRISSILQSKDLQKKRSFSRKKNILRETTTSRPFTTNRKKGKWLIENSNSKQKKGASS